MFHPLVRAHVRRELRSRGVAFGDSFAMAASLSNGDIDDAMASVPEIAGQLGDGSFLKKVEEFLASPLGQALIAILVKLLLGA